jgi:hypothetical protein
MKKISLIPIAIGLLFFCNNSFAQLDQALQAHGGLEQFRQFGTVEFDARNCPFGKNGNVNDHHLVDLKSRQILITGPDYKLGFDGKDVWYVPKDLPLGAPARFYISTPFYFFGMPFLFADPGAVQAPMGNKSLNGKQYDVVKIKYKAGTGDTPEDYYIAYFDSTTHQLQLALYIVSYPMFRQGKPVKDLELHSIVFDGWQKAGGLLVPKKVTFHAWKNDQLGESHGSCTYENVSFKKERPALERFTKPQWANIDESHKQTMKKP